MLASFFGCKLTQNLTHHPTTTQRSIAAHKVIVLTEDGKIIKNNKGEVDKRSMFETNSHHHQGVLIKDLSKDLQPLLIAEDEEVVEAFRHISLPIAGVQHHPEEWFDGYTVELINELLESKDTVLS